MHIYQLYSPEGPEPPFNTFGNKPGMGNPPKDTSEKHTGGERRLRELLRNRPLSDSFEQKCDRFEHFSDINILFLRTQGSYLTQGRLPHTGEATAHSGVYGRLPHTAVYMPLPWWVYSLPLSHGGYIASLPPMVYTPPPTMVYPALPGTPRTPTMPTWSCRGAQQCRVARRGGPGLKEENLPGWEREERLRAIRV